MRNFCFINLNLLRENAIKIKNILPKGVKFNAVVKADAYGHGIEMVASTLYPIVDSYSVSILEEGIALRNAGIDKEILLLIPPTPDELYRVIEYKITPSCESLALIKKLEAIGRKLKRVINFHLKFDTGMNRLGVKGLEKLDEIINYCKGKKYIKIVGLFSHYFDTYDKNAITSASDKFLLAISRVKRYNRDVICHISASGGFLRGKYFDMVRIGILLYGYKPFRSSKVSVKPIMKLYARVISSFLLKKGEHALYGKKVAKSTFLISLIRYGYADGLERRETKGIFNNRCMDISAIKGRKKGKMLLVKNADTIAKNQGTISYEVLVKASLRAEKIYIN